ncbi:hypothetical protein HDU92_002061 [Lobulomyces angularis]|nr:hypothetical protein HDU92_002061 [Lobulomyces angularis]
MSSTTGLSTDIVPDSILSRVVILLIMVIGAIFLPANLAELLELASSRSFYDRKYKMKKGQGHVVLMGDCEAILIHDFLREFFCLDHGAETMTTIVVILNSEEPSADLVAILNDPMYSRRVQYVKAPEISFRSFEKAAIDKSKGCFILSARVSEGKAARLKDAEIVMRALSLRKFEPTIPIYTNISLPQNKIHFKFLAEQVLCIDELKMGMLAQNLISPGFSTALIHLTISVTDNSLNNFLKSTTEYWHLEYAHSVSQEIYSISLNLFAGVKFNDVVLDIYQKYQALLFAFCKADGEVAINHDTVINGDEIGFIITRDASIASNIANGNKTSDSDCYHYTGIDIENPEPSSSKPLFVAKNVKNIHFNNDLSNSSSSTDELVYKGKKGKGTISENTLLKLSPPTRRKVLEDVEEMPAISLSQEESEKVPEFKPTIRKFKNHILICNLGPIIPTLLLAFITPLRHQMKNILIVVLSPEEIDDKHDANDFDFEKKNVVFVTGSALLRKDLDRAGVADCSFAVVTGSNKIENLRTVDSNVLLVVLNIEAMSLNKNLRIVMDLVYTENLKFIGQSKPRAGKQSFQLFEQLTEPSFSSGHCFTQSMLNSVLANSFFNPYLIKLLSLLVFPRENGTGFLRHVKVKEELDGKIWRVVFEKYIEKGVVPFGVYRKGEKGYFVIVNPDQFLQISKLDFIICLTKCN